MTEQTTTIEACATCSGTGVLPNPWCSGDQCGGWGETCEDCRGTGRAASQPADDYQPLPWMCATCVETRLEERDPARPTHCKSCPERYAVRWETNRQIVITAYLDGQVHGRRFYRRDADGAAAAERCVARFAQDGYPLRES